MATSNNSRDVKMTLSVETLGAEGIKQLQTRVSNLAKQGGDAAPEFQKLADEIGRLGEQATALQAFQALSDETSALAARQEQAATSAGELKAKLDTLTAKTTTAAAAQSSIAAELVKVEVAARATRDTLAGLTAKTAAAKAADDSYAKSVSDLKVAKIAQRAEIERLKDAMTSANADVKDAEAAEAKLAGAYRAAAGAADLAAQAAKANTDALNSAASAALDLGVTTDDVAAAQAELIQGLNKSGQAALDLEANVKRLADRQRELDGIRAFEKQAEAAQRMVTAGEYAGLFDEALQRLSATEREMKAQTADEKWQKEAFALVEAAEATKKLARETELLSAVERELAAQAVFEKQHAEAAKLVQASEYVRGFETALSNLAAAEKTAAATDSADKWQRDAFAIVEAAEAAKKLTHETEVLVAAERELAAQAAFEKQAADARQLLQASEYVQFWTSELAKAELQTKQTADAAQASGQKISDAFRTLGVRSAQELQTEIAQVRAAMATVGATAGATGQALSGAFNAGEAKIKSLEREIRAAEGSLTMADKAAGLFANSLGQIAAGNIIADGVGYLVNKVKELGVAFLAAVVQGDQMRRGLTAIYGDAGLVAKQIEFLRKSSSESGVAFGQLGSEFVKFSASMKSANIPLEQSNNLFKAVTAASASLGLGTEATAGALNALGQMASKGTVSMEELRQQLGDRLPGAMGLTAKGLGITEGQLVKLVESGQLATRDFIVPFTEALKTMQAETDGLVPAFDRLKGTMTEMAQGMGDAGGVTLLTGALKLLGGIIGIVALGLSQVVEGLFLVGAAVVATAGSLTGNTHAWEFFNEQVAKSGQRLDNQVASLKNFIAPSDAAAAATNAHTAAMTTQTAEVVKAIGATEGLTASQKMAALSTALAGNASLDASAKIVQYNVAATALLKLQEVQTESYAKLAKAAKQEGDMLVELAKLSGDEVAVRAASTEAADLNLVALKKVSDSQAQETAILVAQKAELIASAAARSLGADKIKDQVEALDKLITKSKADTEQTTQATKAAELARFERQLTIEKTRDHSAEVDKLKKAMDDSTATLKLNIELEKMGLTTKAEVAAARQDATRATALYRDAVSDLTAKTELATKVSTANLQLSMAQASASQNHFTALAAEARALGNTAQATEYDIQAKREAIKVIQLQLQLTKLQQDAALIEIDLKRKLVTGSDEEKAVKLKLLDIEVQMIKIKQAGNAAMQDSIKALEREADALRNGTGARQSSTAGLQGDTGARYANTDAINGQADALQRLQAITSKPQAGQGSGIKADPGSPDTYTDGFGVKRDRKTGAPTGTATSLTANQGLADLQEKKRTQTLDGGDLAKAQEALRQAKIGTDWIRSMMSVAPGSVSTEAITSSNAAVNSAQAILEIVQAAANKANSATAQSGVDAINTANTPAQNFTSHTVNVNIGGRVTAVNVASQADSNALTSILRQLESGKGTAS